MLTLLLTAAIAYLLGSIPFGYILVRAFRGSDIRQSGSGNIGATNVARTSPLLGIVTLVLDALKGLAAVLIAVYWIAPSSTNTLTVLPALAALFAVIGHLFPIWLKFRGGKGVATGLGSFILLAPKAILVMIAIFVVLVALFRYISLGSIVAVAVFPLLAWLLDGYRHTPLMLAAMATASVLIIFKHRMNMRRLMAGTESRFRVGRG
jgi:acyl phosphate:glycerol-3-phosphate acyltransferase